MEPSRSQPLQATIVIADDDLDALRLLERRLTRAGYSVRACVNGEEALEAVKREGICTVVADWDMPLMDGIALLNNVRQLSALNVIQTSYYILLTAQCDKAHVVRGLEAGADDYLTKPYHFEELLARLRAGARIQALQRDLLARQIELQRANADMSALNVKLDRLANIDALTGLSNRRHLLERAAEQWALAARHSRPLSCIMLDVDHFKRVNDSFGHAAGDRVLQSIAAACRSGLRVHDLLGRIGGEELCLICPESDAGGAALLAERLREKIEGLKFAFDGQALRVTASFGVARRVDSQASLDELLAAADRMLYAAKQAGRNQVWVENEVGVCGPLMRCTAEV